MNNILASLKDIATAVMYAAEAGDLEQVLERIAQISRELVNAKYAALGVPDGVGGFRYFKVAGMSPEEVSQMPHLPRGRGLLGVILHERKPVRVERIQDDPRSAGFCGLHPYMESLLGVPIQVGQQLFGILYLCDRRDNKPFDEQDQWLIETMAGYAALAIAGSQLSDQQSRLTLLEERERIGMELHDGVIQSLYALGMHLELIRTAGTVHPNDLKPIVNGLNEVIEDIRAYILDLKSKEFRRKTVYEYFSEILKRLHIPDTLTVRIDAPHDHPPFTPATFEAICLIANEAISNAVRHSESTHIGISARQVEHNFQIIISDDGKGFNLNAVTREDGLGLRNIQQRARIHGGQVQIDTAPGQGTTLIITIPI